jgi:hypothetical protein
MLAASDRPQQPGEVLVTRTAGRQVSGDPGAAPGQVLAGGHEVGGPDAYPQENAGA